MALEFMSLKIANRLPETEVASWTFHPTVNGRRKAMVALLIRTGELFVGTADWPFAASLRQGQSPKKQAFNIAYGKASQRLTQFMRGTRDTAKLCEPTAWSPKEITQMVKQALLD